MPTYPLSYRITDFLERQIAWSRAVIAEIEEFCAAPEAAEHDVTLAHQQRRDREIQALAREYKGLAREWAADTVTSPEDRAAIRRLSEEADKLAAQVRHHFKSAEEFADAARRQNLDAQNDLRRGHRTHTIYRPAILPSPGFLDREA